MGYALAEMAVVHPQAGSFGVYAERYLSPCSVLRSSDMRVHPDLAIGAEVTAVAILPFWFPAVPPWVWVAVASVGLM
jgi:L-asparagine transporter-like permease